MNIPVKILGIVLMHFVMLMMLMSELNLTPIYFLI
ncbi:hypothetical protein BANRA_01628 [Klebsiella pneumoniae]|nr:hypothetical protein BANRA_01628 [Klebsiella pneumoniae]